MKQIVFWGATGHAKVLRELVGHHEYDLAAVFDNNPDVSPPFPDVPIHYGLEGFEGWHDKHGRSETAGLVAIGGAKGRDRLELQKFLRKRGVKEVTVIHPSAFVADNAEIGKGCQVLAHATLCAEATMGDACIINTAASVDHESVLGVGVHVAPGAIVAGCVSIGDFTLIGAGAVVLPRITIGRDAIIGAGSVVTHDIPEGKVAYGNPARVKYDNNYTKVGR